MDAWYWKADAGDGWSAAGVLRPDLLAARVGTLPLFVATPVDGVLLAWAPGTPELDMVIAVGAKEMYESEEGPVTPIVHRWDGKRWSSFAEATPVPAAP
jgi:hypothetical protein